ncbi:hypothetical protein BDR22DRAFT_819596 [Usnea florida]
MTSSQHTVLVTSANGNIGSALIPRLRSEQSLKLILPTTNALNLRSKFHLDDDNVAPGNGIANVVVEQGSIKDPVWVQSLLTDHTVDIVFLCLAGTDEILTTLNFLDAMQRARCIKHLIYLSGCGDFLSDQGVRTLMRTCTCMHTLIKSTLEQKLAYGNLPWSTTVLGPSLFFTNDLRSKNSILTRNTFDEPLGECGASRVSLHDISLAVRNLIFSFSSPHPEKYAGRKIMLGSLHRYTGGEITSLWSRATGREVKMIGCDEQSLDMVEKFLGEKTGRESGWGRDLRLMYETFAREGFGMGEKEYRVQVELLGREPEDYGSWVLREGEGWKGEGGGGVE